MSLVSPLQELAGFQEEIQFEILRRLHQAPQFSRRVLVKDLSDRLGVINFCFQALVKMQNYSQSKYKLRYAYLSTPAEGGGGRLIAEFLRRKVAEYETLQAEMNAVKGGPQ